MILKKILVLIFVVISLLWIALQPASSSAVETPKSPTEPDPASPSLVDQGITLFSLLKQTLYQLGKFDTQFRVMLWDITPPSLQFILGLASLVKYILVLFGLWFLGFLKKNSW